MNILAMENVSLSNIRFFDDDPLIQNSYFPGMDVPVEGRAQLIDSPTDYLLIMSRTFGSNLSAELQKVLPRTVAISTISEILK